MNRWVWLAVIFIVVICSVEYSSAAPGDRKPLFPNFTTIQKIGTGGDGNPEWNGSAWPGGSGGGHTIQNTSGVNLTQRTVFQCYSGLTCEDSGGKTRARVPIATANNAGLVTANDYLEAAASNHNSFNVLEYIPENLWDDIKNGVSTTDVSSYIQQAITDASPGGVVVIPDGRYALASGLTILNEAADFPLRVSIICPAGVAELYWVGADSPTTYMLTVETETGNVGNYSLIQGIRFNGNSKKASGLHLKNSAWTQVEGCSAWFCDIGYYVHSTISSTFLNINADYCRIGLYADKNGGFSQPNANRFLSCRFGNSATAGVHIKGGASATFQACIVEGNGTAGNNATGGMILEDMGIENVFAANVLNGYFESNAGLADIIIKANDATEIHPIFTIENNGFARYASSYAIHMISATGSQAGIVNINKNGFVGLGGYTPSISTTYVDVQSPLVVGGFENNYQQSATEKQFFTRTVDGIASTDSYQYDGTKSTITRNSNITDIASQPAHMILKNNDSTNGNAAVLAFSTVTSDGVTTTPNSARMQTIFTARSPTSVTADFVIGLPNNGPTADVFRLFGATGNATLTGNMTANAFYGSGVGITDIIPSVSGQGGKWLTNNGSITQWSAISHSSLNNLTDTDSHTQYALLAGRSTPQQLAFGSAASAATGYLTSTSHATKGKYFLNSAGTMAVDEAKERLGVGVASPATAIDVTSTGIAGAFERTNSGTNTASAALNVRMKSSVDVSDGYGVGINLLFGDDTVASQALAQLGAVRDGADTKGAMYFSVFDTAAFSEKMRISNSGLTYFKNSAGLPSGNMYSNTSTTITVSASGTWYEVDTATNPDFTAGQLTGVTFSDHYLVAPVAGKYLVNATVSFGTATAGDEIAVSVMVNGTAQASCHGHATVVNATTTVPSSCTTILSLAANDQVSFAVQNHSAARNITLSHANMSMLHVAAQ